MFENQNGDSFQRIPVNIQALNAEMYNQSGEMVWGDYDNDGDGDILWSGRNGCSTGDGSSGLIINSGGNFINGNLPFRSLRADVHLSLADLSNDGVLDMVVYGDPWEGRNETMFFLGNNNKFNQLTLNETPRPHQGGDIEIGDIEGDGDIDVLIAGYAYILDQTVVVYKNNAANGWTIKNERSSVPVNLTVTVDEETASVQWKASHDDTTPTQALTYNIVLVRNDSVLVNPYSRSDGKRQYYQSGNAGLGLNHVFRNLPYGDYKVAVQAIDNSYAGSEFTSYFEFTTGDIVSVEEDFEGSVQFFPNPVEDALRIESGVRGIKEVHISDLQGRECYTSENIRSTRVSIPFSAFEKGVYIVTVHAESGMITRRRVVKR